ncbi:MAG: MaoC/PaaZ C-terminal domain-containing protein [Nocardioidaceae bacterium]
MSDVTVRVLTRSPSLLPLYARALASGVPVVSSLPGLQRRPAVPAGAGELATVALERPGVAIGADHLSDYRQVCGFAFRESVPSTYPHVLAFPMHLAVLTDPGFPFGAMGLVHIASSISQLKRIDPADRIDLHVHAAEVAAHPRGIQVTLVSEARVDGELVWRDDTMLLHRGGDGSGLGSAAPVEGLPEQAPRGSVTWRLPGGLGRRYASVSGDRNPIHLYDVTAKMFGYPRHIAHGMWTTARCLAELENRLPQRYAVSVAFKRPVLLPGEVTFGMREDGHRVEFAVTSADGSTTHLLGNVTPLP